MKRQASIVGTLVFMLFGPLVWGAQMTLAYATHAALCAAGDRLPLGAGALPVVLGGVSVVALVVLGMALAWPAPLRRWLRAPGDTEEGQFAQAVMRLLGLLALFGSVFLGITMLLVPLCMQVR